MGTWLPLALLLATPGGDDLPTLSSELIATGLSMPVQVASAPGDADRLFVVEQAGRVRVIDQGVMQPAPFLDLTSGVTFGGEEGLLGLVFHPDYAGNGALFVYYNDLAGDSVIERFTASPPGASVVDPATAVRILTIPQPASKHNGGTLAFGPLDGMLYLATGDGGPASPFSEAPQQLDFLLGKVLRIDVDGASPYGIPPDNPFVGVPGAREEIWALGLRNPWRFGIDSVTGDLYLGDVGRSSREEIDFVTAGANFGWNCVEGDLCTGEASCACPDPSFTAPILAYDHNIGCAVVGGDVYRGAAIPEFDGRYFYGDYCTGRVFSFEFDGAAVQDHIDHSAEVSPPGGIGLISSFGEDASGELYVVSIFPGTVRRIVAQDSNPDCDGDGVPDGDELFLGTEFDVNANGVPDSCELALTVSPLVAGDVASAEFIGAVPGEPVVFLWTRRGIGPGPCFYSGAWCLDLLPMGLPGFPFGLGLLGVLPADAQGAAGFSLNLPATLMPLGLELSFQAVLFRGADSLTSNPVQGVLQ